MTEEAIRYLFDRIPALDQLRGVARIEAEEAIRDTVSDVIETYIGECETGGAP